ncbi:MAG: adenylate/guanylate cyclase domain-containing protein, partial [Candidatus Gracilibacteria bacterium]
GEKRAITVIFTDIVHFTTLSENLKPESLVALLNEYFEAMSGVILAEGGTLDKFEGDAIMAFFGAPLEQPNHALKACTVALKMRQKLGQLLQKWQTDGPLPGGEKKPMLDFRCGISSGEAIVGNIGFSERFDYTIIGDTVNLGSRLEGANKKYSTSIMISEPVMLLVQNYFEMRELDTIKVMGKNKPMKVYELLNYKGQLVPQAQTLLALYGQGIQLYHERKFAEALEQFKKILETYPTDGPSKLYRQRCEVLKDFPPKPDWDGVFEMGTK